MGYVGLFLGLIIVAVAVYRGWNITLAVFLGSISFIVLSGAGIMDSITAFFTGWGNFATSFLGKMVFSAIFAKLYEVSGAGTAIAVGVSKLIFRENATQKVKVALCFLVGIICQFVLVIGGIGPVLCIFMTVPIFFPLMEQVGIPRRYGVPALVAGALVFGNVAAGAPTNGNVMIVNHLGGAGSDGALSSYIVLAIEIVVIVYLLTNMAVKAMNNGETFAYGPSFKPLLDQERPNAIYSLLPMVVVFVLFGGFHWDVRLALLVGIPLAVAMFWKWLPSKEGMSKQAGKYANIRTWLSAAVLSTLAPLNGMASTSGLAAIMKNTEAYTSLIDIVSGWSMNAYWLTAIITIFMCFVVAGNATSMNISLPIVKPIAEASGLSLKAVGRISAVAGSTFDTVPYSGTLNMFCAYCDCTVREVYPSIFVTTILVPFGATILEVLLCSIGII